MSRATSRRGLSMWTFAGLCLALLPVCLLLGAAPGADKESPHGSPTACLDCHEPVAPGAQLTDFVFTYGGPDEACLECHEAGPHDVGMEPYTGGDEAQEYADLPADWPLSTDDGALQRDDGDLVLSRREVVFGKQFFSDLSVGRSHRPTTDQQDEIQHRRAPQSHQQQQDQQGS